MIINSSKDLLTTNGQNESLVICCSSSSATDLEFIESSVNGSDVIDGEISIIIQAQFAPESPISTRTCSLIGHSMDFSDEIVFIFVPPLYLIIFMYFSKTSE